MLSHHDIPAYKLAYLRVRLAASQSPIDMSEIAERMFLESVDWARNVIGGEPVSETEPA
jgi:hypothetical protein